MQYFVVNYSQYAVHTNIGNRCIGAKVNGKFVPLTTELKNGDVCEILLGAENKSCAAPDKTPARISEAIGKMHLHFKEKLLIPQLARESGMCESSFTRHFKNATGETPVEYLLKLRLQDAADKICNGMAVSEAAYSSGFSDSNYFSRIFKKKYGISPLKFCKIPK